MYAGGIYSHFSTLTCVNSIFTRNTSYSAGVAIYNQGGSLKIINCTFANNGGVAVPGGAGAIYNDTMVNSNSCAEIVNTILWGNHHSHTSELVGKNFDVTYSCVDGGFAGVGNIANNPQFVNESNPQGTDCYYGTLDDGLRLSIGAPTIGVSSDSFPEMDIAETYRIVNFEGKSDLGAYAFVPYGSGGSNSDAVFGRACYNYSA